MGFSATVARILLLVVLVVFGPEPLADESRVLGSVTRVVLRGRRSVLVETLASKAHVVLLVGESVDSLWI